MAALFGKDNKDEKNQTSEKAALAVKSKENTGDAYKILVKPLVSEKSYRSVGLNQYSFKVNPKANKISIARAVEKVYDVKVARVNIITVHGKTKNFGRARGRTSDWKKAIVTLKAGESIAQAQ